MGASGDAAGGPPGRALNAAVFRSLVAAVVGVGVTLGILFTPYLVFGVRSPEAHLVLNTLDAAVGLLAAFLVHGRFLRDGRLQDLLLAQGLALLVIAGLGLNNLTDLLPDARPGTVEVWLPLSVRCAGAVLIAAAAFAGPVRQVQRRRGSLWPVLLLALGLSVVPVLLWAWWGTLPLGLDLSITPESAQQPIFTGHPLLLTAQGLATVAFAVAAVLFTRQARGTGNELLLWLGPACVLGAFARLNYVLFPSLYTEWLYTGDLLRTGFYVLLLVGAAREIRNYWSAQAELAVLEDRRRLARELHDGVIQELSYIKAQGIGLTADHAARQQILASCDRGLEEARAAVVALGAQGDEPLSDVLALATRQLGEQYGVQLTLELDDAVGADAEERHALVRIAREAITNAVKHGGAWHVRVTLERTGNRRRLVVDDDGRGFEVASPSSHGRVRTGYGLVSMGDRARGLGGQLDIESEAGVGSKVVVTW